MKTRSHKDQYTQLATSDSKNKLPAVEPPRPPAPQNTKLNKPLAVLSALERKHLDAALKFSSDDLLKQITNNQVIPIFSQQELIYLIAEATVILPIKYESYFQLIPKAPLDTLIQLMSFMNFNYRNKEGCHALLIAARYGRTDLVSYLVNICRVSLTEVDNEKNDVVRYAVNYGQMALLDKLTSPLDENGFGLELNPNFILQHPYSNQFLVAFQAKPFSATGVSTVSIYHRFNYNVEVFSQTRSLGEGTYGNVNQYTSINNKSIAVKFIDSKEVYNGLEGLLDLADHIKKISREYKYLCKAYPTDEPYALQHVIVESDDKNNPGLIYSARIIMSFIPGMHILAYLAEVKTPRQLLGLFLDTAYELQRIHSLGLIHGDIRPGNIMIVPNPDGTYKIRFIDFGFTYKITRFATSMVFDKKETMVAPERNNANPPAHTSQDVYSLGAAFLFLLKQWKLFSSFGNAKELKVIRDIFTATTHAEPVNRCTLTHVIKEFMRVLSNGNKPADPAITTMSLLSGSLQTQSFFRQELRNNNGDKLLPTVKFWP